MLKEYHIVTKPRKFSSSSLVRIKSSEKRDCEKNCVIVSHFFRTNSVQSAVLRYQLKKRQNMRNYFAVCFSNTQVKPLISQPLGKRCSKASFSVLSQIYAKMQKSIFTKFFLILETKRLFHNLLINGVQKLASAVISPTKRKI